MHLLSMTSTSSNESPARVCRFARVVNLDDVVPRVPTFFADTGNRHVHVDGKHTSW